MRHSCMCSVLRCFARPSPPHFTVTLSTSIPFNALRYHETLPATHWARCITWTLARMPQRAIWFMLRAPLHRWLFTGLHSSCSTCAHAFQGCFAAPVTRPYVRWSYSPPSQGRFAAPGTRSTALVVIKTYHFVTLILIDWKLYSGYPRVNMDQSLLIFLLLILLML